MEREIYETYTVDKCQDDIQWHCHDKILAKKKYLSGKNCKALEGDLLITYPGYCFRYDSSTWASCQFGQRDISTIKQKDCLTDAEKAEIAKQEAEAAAAEEERKR